MERATKVKEKILPKAKSNTLGRNAASIEASKVSSKAKPKVSSIIASIENRNSGGQPLRRNRKPNDAFLDKSDRIRRKRVKTGEKYTPIPNSVSEKKYNAESDDPVRTTPTPPLEASISPEIQIHSNSAAPPPLCYGAGHLLSGVTDRRKCRRRGSLRATANPNTTTTPFSGTTDPVSVCEQISVPLLCEASVNWLSSPNSWEHFGNIIQTPESDSGNRTAILPPSEEDPGCPLPSSNAAGSSISSWESDATIDDKNSTVKISWKDEQAICKSDEFDRCCLDADIASPVMILDCETVVFSKKTNRKEEDPCAESYSTNGGSLIVSQDSNWTYS
ncbi:hypothetical protein M569_02075 [Genlisea aurea]|uniref:Uncharacterized protein n=1 Tax=Genlisea aurea TaxID=192259 RepID=S8D5H4_9LAMI|nr:hypothetical protein M569_02075 [Genlisea aurea]